MGASVSVKGEGKNERSFVHGKIRNASNTYADSSNLQKAFAKHIKDGTWMNRLGRRIPKLYLNFRGYKLPFNVDVKGEISKSIDRASFDTVDMNNFQMEELRLFLLAAISDDFEKHAERSTRRVSGDTTLKKSEKELEEIYSPRVEVDLVQELLSQAATYYDEDEYSSFLSNPSWSSDFFSLMYDLQTPITVFKKNYNDNSEISLSLVYANKSWEKMTKHRFKECEGKNLQELMLEPDSGNEQIDLLHEAISSSFSIKLGFNCKRRTGESFLNLMGVVPVVTDGQGTFHYVAIVHSDASKKKEFEKNLMTADELMTLLPLII